MANKITIILLSIFCIIACGKKCKDAADKARTKPKNTALMYIWRYTDNLIVKKSSTMNSDSGFLSFKPNGDYMYGSTITDLKAVPDVWYLNNDIIVTHYCTENIPGDNNIAKYFIRHDTLFLNYYNDANIIATPKTYVHHWKY